MAVTWLAEVLRAAGVAVVEYPGWRTRAAPGTFTPRAVIWHHDASAPGPSPGLPRLIAEVGNSTTPPPLAQAWVDTAGTWWLTAAGRANHAGTGTGWGRIPANAGNTYAVGVETDHTVGEVWPAAQLTGLRRGTAAILRRLGASPADALCGHKEYAPGRKIDPDGLDMTTERRLVAAPIQEDTVTCAINTSPGGDRSLWQASTARVTALLTMSLASDAEEGDPGGPVPNELAKFLKELRAAVDRIVVGGIDYAALAAVLAPALVPALADELDRRARDNNPATGPVT